MSDNSILQAGDFLLTSHDAGTDELTLETYKLEDIENKIIQKVLRKHKGNITRAAQELGLTRTSLYRRLEKYGL
jgi:transcriptional regulator with PAS, ATPase and Fis domain